MKAHLVDGTYELFRMYYGAPSSLDAEGREVGAARALVRTLTGLLRQDDVTHVGIAFDHVIESFRNDLFAGYKTGEGMDPLLWAQFPIAERVAAALGITVWPMVEFEADDALASAAAQLAEDPAFLQIVICSPDKDLAQCIVGDRIVGFDRRKRVLLDEDGVREKFGISPASIPDFLALVGDSADGIPGIPRWGAKGAAAVLAHYGHIEAIPDDASAWEVKVRGSAALAENLAARREDAMLYRRLATLRTDVPIDASVLEWRGPSDDLAEVCAALGEKLPTF